MEPTLIAVTLLSLGMAVAMGIVAWRLLREERRRSAARVARLAELAAGEDHQDGPHAGRARPAPPAIDLPLRAPDVRPAAPAVQAVPMADGLFAAAAPSSGGGHTASVFAVAAILVGAIVAGLVWLGGSRAPEESRAITGRAAPLELVSLRHTKEHDTLTITGLVQNPKDGRDLTRVTAVAFIFDQAGEFVGSGRAPLEFTQLAPGAESPFQIVVANAGSVGRYRIGFRTEDGAVLGHVDRRPSASAGEPGRAPASARSGAAEPAVAPR
jgi:hypothetical protein